MEAIKKILDRPIAFHRCFITLTGSVNAALMLSQAMYWSNRTSDPDGWFFKRAEEWEEEIGLTRHEQDNARAKLRKTGFWEEARRGAPATMHFRVDGNVLQKKLAELVETRLPESGKLNCRKAAGQIAGKRQTELPESGKLNCRKAANKMGEKRQTLKGTETTAETTTETTAERARAQATPFGGFEANHLADLTPNLSPLEFALCSAVGWLPDSLGSLQYEQLRRSSIQLSRYADVAPERIARAADFYRSQGKFGFGVEWIARDWGLISAWIEAQSNPAPLADKSRSAQRQQASARAKEILFGGGDKR